jgi:hypothetical protein
LDFANSTFGVKKCTFAVENPSFGNLILFQAVVHFHKMGKSELFSDNLDGYSLGSRKKFRLFVHLSQRLTVEQPNTYNKKPAMALLMAQLTYLSLNIYQFAVDLKRCIHPFMG